MRAMILAAGRGERLRPLTDTTPKPLLQVAGRPLIDWTLERLAHAGYRDIVINVSHLAEAIMEHCGLGEPWGLHIRYSPEPVPALETAGGIRNALEMLGPDPFLVINGDVWCDHDLRDPGLDPARLGHLMLAPNPDHHPGGDFTLDRGCVGTEAGPRYTFTGIAWYRPELFAPLAPGPRPLGPLLREAAARRQLSGELHAGVWLDVGSPARLERARTMAGESR